MRTGIDASTGKILTGWEHCCQSMARCIRTRFASRVLRRYLGSAVPLLQDANADSMTIFKVFIAIADALNDPLGGEPGFSLTKIELVEYGRAGRFAFMLDGDYFPRGHLGDFTVLERRQYVWVQ